MKRAAFCQAKTGFCHAPDQDGLKAALALKSAVSLLVHFNRQETFVGESGQQSVFDVRGKAQGQSAVGGQLTRHRDQKKRDLRLLENFFRFENPVYRVKYGDEIVFFNHQKTFTECPSGDDA
ncbi:MAG: hypothetical protein P8Y91_08205 [Desulfuromonadales bacterium]